MELKNYWQIIWKRRWWSLLAFIAVLAVAAGFTFTMPPSYEASTRLLFEARDRTSATLGRELGGDGDRLAASREASPIDTQAEILKSGPIVSRVIARAALTDETGEPLGHRAFLAGAHVAPVKGTDLLELRFEHSDAATAKRVVDAWASVYLDQSRAGSRLDANDAVSFIKEQVTKTKSELQAAESALSAFKQRHGAIDLGEEARISVASLSELQAHLRQASAAERDASARVVELRRKVGLNANQALASTAIHQDPALQRLRQQLVEAETDPLLSQLAANHPDVLALKTQIANLKRAITYREETLLGGQARGTAKNLDPLRQSLTSALVQAEVELSGHRQRVETLRRQIGTYSGQLASMPGKEQELTRLTRNANVLADTHRMLLQRYEEAKIQAALTLGNISIVQAAELPDQPIRPKKRLYMLAALAVAMFVSVGLAMLLEYLDDTLQTIEEIEGALPLPLLGILPFFPTRKRLVALDHARSPAAEAYRTLRTNVKFLSSDTIRTLTVTSAGASEGKSTTIANMAIAFAQGGKRVLLVDADLRKPVLHAMFELPNQYGLTSVLAGQVTLDTAIKPSRQAGLDVLVSGPFLPDSAEVIESEAMQRLITEVRSRYDMVLFDAPPVIAVTDASLLASRLDGLIMVVGVNRVTHKAARHALKLLKSAKVKVWGMVAQGMRPDHDAYYHAYFHAYYGEVEQSQKKRAGWAASIRLTQLWQRPEST